MKRALELQINNQRELERDILLQCFRFLYLSKASRVPTAGRADNGYMPRRHATKSLPSRCTQDSAFEALLHICMEDNRLLFCGRIRAQRTGMVILSPVAEAVPKDCRSTTAPKWEMCHGMMRDPKLFFSSSIGLLPFYPMWYCNGGIVQSICEYSA